VVHRRSDGSPCFFNDEDYLVYLDCLKDASERLGCAIHAYALMPDHLQLLASPDSETGLARLMSCISDYYVGYVNYVYQRNGEFWGQEPRVTVIDGDEDLLACYRAIEVAPVQARLAPSTADYRWSSYRHHAFGSEDAIICEHPAYLRLGTTQLARQLAYQELFRQPGPDRAPDAIGPAAGREPTLGSDQLEDGIKRSVRGLAWQARNVRQRRIARMRQSEAEARGRANATDMTQARANAARGLASK
jgi:putative transposase